MEPLGLAIGFANAILIWVCLKTLVRRPFDAVALYFYGVGLFLVARPILISLGLHRAWPSDLFSDELSTQSAVIDAQLLVTLWIVSSAAGFLMLERTKIAPLLSMGEPAIQDRHLYVASLTLFALSIAVTVPLWIEFGGPSGLTRAFKVEKVVGSTYLRLIPMVGSIVSAASVLSRFRANVHERRRLRLAFRLAVFAGCAYLSYSWGARDAPVFGLLTILLGRLVYSRAPLARRAQIALSALVLVGCIVGLRIARDIAIQDQVQTSISEENLVGQLTVASNLTMFDAFTLVVRDGPPGGEFHGGDDFIDAARRALPGLSPPSESRNVAVQVAQTYRPERANGWPVTALGDWYINFGIAGSILGGVLSGMVVNVVRKKAARFERDPLVYAVSIFVMGTVLRTGVWARSINLGWQLLVALAVVVIGIRLLPLRGPDPAERAPSMPKGSKIAVREEYV